MSELPLGSKIASMQHSAECYLGPAFVGAWKQGYRDVTSGLISYSQCCTGNFVEVSCPTPSTDDTGNLATPDKKRYILVGIGERVLSIAKLAQLASTQESRTVSVTPFKNETSPGLMRSRTYHGGMSRQTSGIGTGDGFDAPSETTDPTLESPSDSYMHSGVRGRLERAAWRLRHPNWRAAIAVPPPEHQGFMLHENQPIEFAGQTITGRLRCSEPNFLVAEPRPKVSPLFRYSTASIEYRMFLHYGYGPKFAAQLDSLTRMNQEMEESCQKARAALESSIKLGAFDRKELGKLKYRRRYLRSALRRNSGKGRGRPTRR